MSESNIDVSLRDTASKNNEKVSTSSLNLEEQNIGTIDELQADFSNFQFDFETKKKLFLSWENPKQVRPSKTWKQLFLWYPLNSSSFEKKIIFKLDCFILSFSALSFFIKYLDSSNVSYAYVSGMKEHFNMKGDEYNWLEQCFSITYSVFGIMGPLLLTRYRPNIVLPIFEAGWSLLCILVITCKSYKSLMVVRALQGAMESVLYPSIFYILGTFYKREILVSRSAVYIFAGCVGPLVGGLIQSGVVSLNNRAGLLQWQWPFVIDFIISLPVAIFGFFVLPSDPQDRKPNFYLSLEEVDFLRETVAVVKNVESTNKFNFGMIKRALSSWQFYVFIFAYTISQMTESAGNFFAIVLDEQNYNIYDRNNIPTIQSGVKAVTTLLVGFLIDWRGKFCEIYAVLLCFWISGLSILVKWDVPRAAELYAYSIIGVCAPVSVIVVSWANEMTKEDKQVRAITLGCLNLISAFGTTPLELKLFNTDLAPRFKNGMRVGLSLVCLQFVYNWVIVWFDRYQSRKRDYINEKMNGVSSTVAIDEKPEL